MNGGSRDLESARLQSAIRSNLITPDVRRHGFGAVDPARLARSIEQIAADFKFRKMPQSDDVFDDASLPPPDARMPGR
jgi:NitT/TauT family transport system substrate-binding protein